MSVNKKNEGQHKKVGLKTPNESREKKRKGFKGAKGRKHEGQQTE